MPLSELGPGDRLPAKTALPPVAGAPGSRPGPSVQPSALPGAAQPERVALAPYREPGMQHRMGQLQQGLAYSRRLSRDLQELKAGLGQALALGQMPQALPAQLDAVRQTWQARATLSGGQLDGRLQAVAEGELARQRFQLRGLDLQALAAPGAETLRLSLPGQPRTIAVALDGQGLQPALRSLQRALAPTGLRAAVDGGQLQLSVVEHEWPALREGLSLRGDGKRFPSGQMLRMLPDPQPEAISPAAWAIDSPQAQRRSLAQVLAGLQQLDVARQQIEQRLVGLTAAGPTRAEEVSGQAAMAASSAASFSANFAAAFREKAGAELLDFARLSELTPALLGLHRRRVEQLL